MSTWFFTTFGHVHDLKPGGVDAFAVAVADTVNPVANKPVAVAERGMNVIVFGQTTTTFLVLSFLLLGIDGIDTNLLVVLLERREILTRLRELSFLHTLANVPVDKRSLAVEQIELVVEASPGGGDAEASADVVLKLVSTRRNADGCHSRRGIGQHAKGSRNLGEVTSWNKSRRLVADTELPSQPRPPLCFLSTHLEAGGTPVNELNGSLGTNVRNSSVDVFRHDVSSVEKTTSHVFALPRVTLDHLVVGFETRDSHFRNRVGLVEG